MANEYDKAARYQVKQDAPGIFAWLWRCVDPPLVFHSWIDARRLATPAEGDLTCDLVATLRPVGQSHPTHVLVLELKAESADNTLYQLQGYIYRLCTEPPPEIALLTVPAEGESTDPEGARRPERKDLQVGGVILNLTGGPKRRSVSASFPGLPECDWQFQVLQRNLHEEDAAATLADIQAGRTTRWLLPWIPLMHGGGEPGIMEGWKQAAQVEPDNEKRATLVAFALLFAELAGRGEEWKRALEGWNVLTSKLVEEWRASARVEGLVQGRAEGHLETTRGNLRMFLEKRFGPLPQEFAQKIEATTDAARLNEAIQRVLDIQSLEELGL